VSGGLRIVGAEAILTRVPTKRPHAMAIGTTRFQESVFVRIDTDEGISGWGEAPHMVGHSHAGETQASVALQLRERLLPAIMGRDPMQIEAIQQELGRTLPMNPRAKSAINIALHDLAARRLGTPVYNLLGGLVRDRIPLSWSIGSMAPADAAAEAERMVEMGIRILKIKVGARLDWEEDAAVVEAVRAAVGEDIRIRADANQGYDVRSAILAVRRMSAVGLESMEQPVHADDLEGMAEVRQAADCYIMADESAHTARDVYEIARRRAADIVSIYINTGGGISAAHRMGILAETTGLISYLGGALEGPVGARACLQFGAATPSLTYGCEMAGQFLLEADLSQSPIQFVDGDLIVEHGPGLSADIDPDKLATYEIGRFQIAPGP
jgi:muconate cycloisomerase